MASPPYTETEAAETPRPSAIPSPRRLLILSTAHHSPSVIPPLLHTLTGVAVTSLPIPPQSSQQSPSKQSDPDNSGNDTSIPPSSTFAGYTSHSPLRLETKYYTADIPIWVDEVPYTHPATASPSTSTSTATSAPQNSSEPTDPPSNASPNHPSAWRKEFLTQEARVVRDAIGAVIVCLPTNSARQTKPGVAGDAEAESLKDIVEAVGGVRDLMEEERGGVGDVPGLVVLVGKREGDGGAGAGTSGKNAVNEVIEDEEGLPKAEGEVGWWEESLLEMGVFGWEVVTWDPKEDEEEVKGRRNQFGELEGLERVKEVLEANEWASADDDDDDQDTARLGLLSDVDEGDEGFNLEVGELEREMLGLKMAIEKGGGDGDEDEEERDEEMQVEELEGLMLKMQAVKEKGAELPEAERKKFAIKAVQDILKDI